MATPNLTGPEKAVLFLLSLDESIAAPIVAELEEHDVRKLREIASMMRAVPANSLDYVYEEFIDKAREAVAVPQGGMGYLRRLAAKALGEDKANAVFSGAAPATALDRISSSDPVAVGSVLESEHPQVIAAILSQLEPNKSASIIAALSDELQVRVVGRLATMTELPAGLLEGVINAVASELPARGADAAISVDGVNRAANLVKKMSKEQGETLLAMLDGQPDVQPGVSDKIRSAMYTFQDLNALDAKGFRTLLKEIQPDKLVVAMKTASEEIRQKIFSSMSQRAAELLRDDLDNLTGVKLADVEAAQREIVDRALALAAEGQINLGGDEELV